MAKKDWVSASEIGSYVFCPRRYWLDRVKKISLGGNGDVLQEGVRNHHRHGVRYDWQRRFYRLARWGLLFAIVAALAALLVGLKAV